MNEKVVSVGAVEVEPVVTSYASEAQARVQELRSMRTLIPRFTIPVSPQETTRLSAAASVPPEFVELTAMAAALEQGLTRGQAVSSAEMRDLMSYADAYAPLADELEAMAQFVRHSVIAARNVVGSEALTIYALAQRLAKRPTMAHLAPHVADMRRALGKMQSAQARERRAAKRAARLAAAQTQAA
ncbi:MAG TPA: hypothetical protein VF618_17330 [Thermoanaerobaculia bacterium]